MASSHEQLVRNQLLLRDVNERIAEVAAGWTDDPPAFLCECSNDDCEETLALSRDEYEIVRSSLNLFVVFPGHEVLAVDRVVDARERFTLVEKTKHTELVLTWQREARAKGA
jgi:hypothetical protein